jgi:hypothetical protein
VRHLAPHLGRRLVLTQTLVNHLPQQLYDRRHDEVSLDEVERIVI